MRILFVDNACSGHHLQYMSMLAQQESYESIFMIPEHMAELEPRKQYICNIDIEKKNPMGYIRFMKLIADIARKERVDIIHFLSIDPMVKYFGLFLGVLGMHRRIFVTCHHFRYSRLHDFARRRIFRHAEWGIVHTGKLQEYAFSKGIRNCAHIEYPSFMKIPDASSAEARAFFGISENAGKVIACIGGTRHSKGLDILLNALQKVEAPFHLLVAGKQEYFDRSFIEEKLQDKIGQTTLCLKYLTDEELSMAMAAADIVVLPYRKVFDGASGPLGEGVSMGKMVVGACHGSLGRLIQDNDLGYTFESENPEALAETLNHALTEEWTPGEAYKAYQSVLNPKRFQKEYLDLYQKR